MKSKIHITVEDELIPTLNHLALEQGRTVSNLIEQIIKKSLRNELAQKIIEDGQPIRATTSYLISAWNHLNGKTFGMGDKFEDEISFLEQVEHAAASLKFFVKEEERLVGGIAEDETV